MHGLGNDFVIIDKRVNKITITKELISKLSDRKSGAGCDQLITINNSSEKDNDIDAEIKIYNPSGDQAEDGIRDSSTSRGLGDVYKRQGLMYLSKLIS